MEKKDLTRVTDSKSKHKKLENTIILFGILLFIFGIFNFCSSKQQNPENKELSEQREFIKNAKIGVVDKCIDISHMFDQNCLSLDCSRVLNLKDGKILFLPNKLRLQTVYDSSDGIKIYHHLAYIPNGQCVAYEIGPSPWSDLVCRLSLIPVEWGITKDTAFVRRIEDGGNLYGTRQKIITTDENRQLLCPEDWVEREKLGNFSKIYFETYPETKQVKLIVRINR